MAGTRTRSMFAFVASLTLLLSLLLVPSGARSAAISAYLPHNPIAIIGDANFTAANGVVAGSGTADDPFIIERWQIQDGVSANGTIMQSGIWIQHTDAHFVIRDMLITANYNDPEAMFPYGIAADSVTNGTVERVTVSHNLVAFRVWGGSSNLTLSDNVAVSNNVGIGVGSSSNLRLEGNNMSEGGEGIFVGFSSRVTIAGNTLANTQIGVVLSSTTNSSVYHNNFVNSSYEQAVDSGGGGNVWDDGYPGGGNYWSNYSGEDRCRGPSQEVCTGPDGIGDTSFVFGANFWYPDSRGEDRYPLMAPFQESAAPPLKPAAGGFLWGVVAVGAAFVAAVVILGLLWWRWRPRRLPPPSR